MAIGVTIDIVLTGDDSSLLRSFNAVALINEGAANINSANIKSCNNETWVFYLLRQSILIVVVVVVLILIILVGMKNLKKIVLGHLK